MGDVFALGDQPDYVADTKCKAEDILKRITHIECWFKKFEEQTTVEGLKHCKLEMARNFMMMQQHVCELDADMILLKGWLIDL